jgi:hypothetical protein
MAVFTFTRRAVFIAVFIALIVGLSAAWGFYGKYKKLQEAYDFAQKAGEVLKKENGDITVQYRKISEELSQAEATTTSKESELKDALERLELSESARALLEDNMANSTPDEVAETVATIVIPDTVFVTQDDSGTTHINTEWLDATLREGQFKYNFRATFHYNRVTSIGPNGERQILENAYIKSLKTDSRLSIPVVSEFTIRRPERVGIHRNLSLHAGYAVLDNAPYVGATLYSVGYTTEGSQVFFSMPAIGFTLSKDPRILAMPLSINIGRYLPLFHNLNISGGVSYGFDRFKPVVVISTVL